MSQEIIGRGWGFPLGIDAQGGLSLTSQRSELDQAIMIILTTAVGERVMRPTFGSRLHELVFAPVNQQTLALAAQYVEEALAMWEPRIVVTQVNAEPDRERDGRILIHLEYEVKATNDLRSLVYPFYLIPEES